MDSLKAGKAISFRVSYNVKLCVPAIVTQATVNVMDGRVARRVRSNLVGLTIDGCSPSDHK
jgi:phosphatidylserine synthase